MLIRERRTFLILVLLVSLIVLVGGVNWFAFDMTRERPNYTQIEEGLWLGGSVQEPPPKTHAVLNLCETPDKYHVAEHRHMPIKDAAPAPTLDWLREQVAFIKREREQGHVVFVHCMNGVSRSVMVMLAYLMAREGWTLKQATDYVKAKRDIIRPNNAFQALLSEWEAEQRHR